MTDMSLTIAPKSDQLNADDLIAGPITVRITKVSANPESAEQPISISFEGDSGKPYRPCKSMRRVMVQVWGKDGLAYAGRSMTLYRDPKVQFGGLAVGGIRISHMSHIKSDVTMALTATRANKKAFTVHPLVEAEPAAKKPTATEWLNNLEAELDAAADAPAVDQILARDDVRRATTTLRNAALERLNKLTSAALAKHPQSDDNGAQEDDGWPGPDVAAAA